MLKHCKSFCFYLRKKITSSLHWLFAISVKASSWLIWVDSEVVVDLFLPSSLKSSQFKQVIPMLGSEGCYWQETCSYIILLDLKNEMNVCCFLSFDILLAIFCILCYKSTFLLSVNKKSPSVRINQFYFFKRSGPIHIIRGCLAAW